MSAPLSILRLHHIALATTHPEASTAFYRDVLGFRPIERPSFNFRGAWLANYGLQIHLIENHPFAPEQGEIQTRSDHLAFEVDDVEPVIASLSSLGILFRDQVNAGGTRQIFFQDPDGHHIELASYGPQPPEVS